MQIHLHKNATTTPAQRQFIQQNPHVKVAELAQKLGVSETTIRKWKKRDSVYDGSHTPKKISKALTQDQEIIAVLLRLTLQLGLDDLLYVVRSTLEQQCSRSTLNRCLNKYRISRLERLDKYMDGDLKNHRGAYLYHTMIRLPMALEWEAPCFLHTLLDCSSRWCYAEIIPSCITEDTVSFLEKAISLLPVNALGILLPSMIEFSQESIDQSNKNQIDPVNLLNGVESYCRKKDLEFYPLAQYQQRTFQHLRSISFTRIPSPWPYMDSLSTHLMNYNMNLRQRHFKMKTSWEQLQSRYSIFPSSFKFRPGSAYVLPKLALKQTSKQSIDKNLELFSGNSVPYCMEPPLSKKVDSHQNSINTTS